MPNFKGNLLTRIGCELGQSVGGGVRHSLSILKGDDLFI